MNRRRRVFGLHAAETAIEQAAETIAAAWVNPVRTDARLARLIDLLAARGIACERGTKHRLDDLAGGGNHQGIVLEMSAPADRNEHDLYAMLAGTADAAMILVLDQVQDPHNLGACLRTADATGATAVVVPKDQSVGLTPTVAKVACGAAETVPFYRVTNLARCLDQLKEAGLWIVGAAGEAERSLYETDLTVPVAVVLGAEGKGMRRLTREKCDWTVGIPMQGRVDSLNVSVAAAVLLYETVRQRMVHSRSGS